MNVNDDNAHRTNPPVTILIRTTHHASFGSNVTTCRNNNIHIRRMEFRNVIESVPQFICATELYKTHHDCALLCRRAHNTNII